MTEINPADPVATRKHALAIREQLNTGGTQAAEKHLILIADNEGDGQLAIIVKELTPGEVMTMVGAGDFTKPSLIVHFITPAQFLGAIERIGAKWGSISGADDSVLAKLLEELTDMIISVLLVTDEEKRNELLTALIAHQLGLRTLVCIAIEVKEFLLDYDPRAVEKGTVEELMAHLDEVDHDVFETIQRTVNGLCLESDEADRQDRAREEPEGESEEEALEKIAQKKCLAYQRRALTALIDTALRLVENEPTEGEPKHKEVFGNL